MNAQAPEMAGLDQPKAEGSSTPSLCGLFEVFQRLDRRLEQAIAAAEKVFGAPPGSDSYRGLYITRAEANRLLSGEPGSMAWPSTSSLADDTASDQNVQNPRLSSLSRAFGLSPFEVDAIVIALAPEVDLRYERLYAYLQDDVTRRRPTLDLVLNLLCNSSDEKLLRRECFAASAPLIRNSLIFLVEDPHHVQPPLLSQYMKLDEQIVNFLLGQTGLDARLMPFCRLRRLAISFEELELSAESKSALRKLAAESRKKHQPLRLYFTGNNASEIERAASALARNLQMKLLHVDLNQAITLGADLRATLPLLFREAWFRDALIYFQGVDKLREDHPALHTVLMNTAAGDKGITLFESAGRGQPFRLDLANTYEVSFPISDFRQRASSWRGELAKHNVTLEEREIDEIAGRFRLGSDQIKSAVIGARSKSAWCAATTLSDLYAAARAQCRQTLGTIARRIEPLYTWDDIVLPPDALRQLREICQRVIHRQRVFGDWGFNHKLSLGKGVNALFSGPSGTGKTMAAEIVATELELDLYKIDLSTVVSKWIGETEKNLDRIFTAAENSNAILFFDEADALFGKRSEVRDSHDRYANLEISYLLQKMEEYQGIAILASNLRANLDDAFLRRLNFVVSFPFPDEVQRLRIWQQIWPEETPLADDVDLHFLAHEYKLTGGNVKNVALAAAFLAAQEGSSVTMDHLLQAIRREYQKLGKSLPEQSDRLAARSGT